MKLNYKWRMKDMDSEICQMVDREKAWSTVGGLDFQLLSLPSSRGHEMMMSGLMKARE